jgi:UTP--glucose-1-phosphate uridylyltransferase
MKAIIPAAGYGSRFLPASKAVPKELLPILDKPAIQWIVEEALAAGAEEVIIVTSPEKPSIRSYFSDSGRLKEQFAGRSQAVAALEHLDALSKRVRFSEQAEQRGLGHAVLQAAELLSGESDPVLILLGDALVCGPQPCSCEIVALSRSFGGASVVGLERVPREKVSRYGIAAVEPAAGRERVFRLARLVEKPAPEDAPSDLAVAGRYLLSPLIFELLADQRPGCGGEIQLTDAIQRLLAREPVYGCQYAGQRHDIGNPAGYLKALNAFST